MAHLTDIDSLLLQVRDAESKKLIEEAVTAYRGGALRSAIVATWIAAVYDAIAKLRELKDQGDGIAKDIVNKIDSFIQNSDTDSMMKIERGIFSDNFITMQLITQHELELFEQLRQDRHRCAHPAFVSDDLIFRPSLELVRMYIVHVLNVLLIHAPLHGKHAIKLFNREILSSRFLDHQKAAIYKYIKDNFLRYAKDAFIENLIVQMLSMPLDKTRSLEAKDKLRISFALGVVNKERRMIFERVSKNYISRKYNNIPVDGLLDVLCMMHNVSDIEMWLTEETKESMKAAILQSSFDYLHNLNIFQLIEYTWLKRTIHDKIVTLQKSEKTIVFTNCRSKNLVSVAIFLYEKSIYFSDARDVSQYFISPLIDLLEVDDIDNIFKVYFSNNQVRGSNNTMHFFHKIFDQHPQYDISKWYDPLFERIQKDGCSLNSEERALFDILESYKTRDKAIS